MKSRPNVLFILVDCLRSRAIFDSSRGGNTPTLSKLISEGTAFRTCVATCTTTSPSMGSLFTGTLPFVHGVRSLHDHKLDPGVATLAEILRDDGYLTHAETTGPVVTQKGFDRGFTVFNHREHRATLHQAAFWSDLQTRLASLSDSRPWFFYLHLWEMHRPRFVPKAFDSRQYGRHRYERALSAVDHLRLPRILELAGPDTLVVITGDHGEIPRYDLPYRIASKFKIAPVRDFFDVRSGHGHHVFEDLVIVPMILAGPGVPAHGVVDTAVRHIDLFPTILELTAVEDPRRSQATGKSLVELFDGAGADRPGYSEAVEVKDRQPENWLVSVRHEGWKYVRRPVGDDSWLWRLPDERTDLAAQYPDVVARMEELMAELRGDRSLSATGGDLSEQESSEVEAHLRELGYLD